MRTSSFLDTDWNTFLFANTSLPQLKQVTNVIHQNPESMHMTGKHL